MKKIFAILMAMIMMLSMVAMAAGSITVESTNIDNDTNTAEEVYYAYQILTADSTGEVYSIKNTDTWYEVLADEEQIWLTLTATATDKNNFSVTLKAEDSEATAKALAAYLLKEMPENAPYTELKVGANEVADGYYLVTTTMGSALVLDTFATKTLKVKNEYPALTKAVEEEYYTVGETVKFTLTLTVPGTISSDVTVHDKMDAALSLNADSITATIDGEEVDFTKSETMVDSTCTFELVFDDADVSDKTVVITYTAEMLEGATLVEKSENTAWLTYSKFSSKPETVDVETFDYSFIKVDANDDTPLKGATFVLKNEKGEEIKVVGADGTYTVADSTADESEFVDIVSPESGIVVIKGLGDGKYTLTETVAPTGYNLMTEDHKFEIVDKDIVTGVKIVNAAGTALPSTGGIGTTIFYVVGGLMMAAAIVLLVTKKKVAASK